MIGEQILFRHPNPHISRLSFINFLLPGAGCLIFGLIMKFLLCNWYPRCFIMQVILHDVLCIMLFASTVCIHQMYLITLQLTWQFVERFSYSCSSCKCFTHMLWNLDNVFFIIKAYLRVFRPCFYTYALKFSQCILHYKSLSENSLAVFWS